MIFIVKTYKEEILNPVFSGAVIMTIARDSPMLITAVTSRAMPVGMASILQTGLLFT